jgi:alpha,alpha-trehalase
MGYVIDPRRFDAVLFDLDGVITDTASVHEAAWTQLFDEFLAERPEGPGEDRRPFSHADYLHHVDGRLLQDGVAGFLASRGIALPVGEEADPADAATVHGLGHRKTRYYNERISSGGVAVFDSTVLLVRALQAAGLGTAVFTASRSCTAVLEAAGLAGVLPVQVDGVVAADLGLPGKPDPALLLEAARRLGVEPARAVVVEDAIAGVEAGRRGGFGLVIGIDRIGQGEALLVHGADVVVRDLVEVDVGPAHVGEESA